MFHPISNLCIDIGYNTPSPIRSFLLLLGDLRALNSNPGFALQGYTRGVKYIAVSELASSFINNPQFAPPGLRG
jgi:hypothetical protein